MKKNILCILFLIPVIIFSINTKGILETSSFSDNSLGVNQRYFFNPSVFYSNYIEQGGIPFVNDGIGFGVYLELGKTEEFLNLFDNMYYGLNVDVSYYSIENFFDTSLYISSILDMKTFFKPKMSLGVSYNSLYNWGIFIEAPFISGVLFDFLNYGIKYGLRFDNNDREEFFNVYFGINITNFIIKLDK